MSMFHFTSCAQGPGWGARRSAAGLTLVELLLALAVTGMVAAAVAGMLLAVSTGTSQRTDMRGLVVKQRALSGRIHASVRNAKMVLAQGQDYLVLWTGDPSDSGSPNLAELRLIERTEDGRLISYAAAFPEHWNQAQVDAANTSFALNDDFRAVTNQLKADNPYFVGELWATGVNSWIITLDAGVPQHSRLVSYRLVLRAGGGATAGASGQAWATETLIGAVALRN
jgi:Tfp pilus assembly protein PilE